ncbi:glycosyltransferase [Roseococcus sp. SDR]|uniref:glycosyltransferase n=1 Tax=Roseococcus sp. SDR TaxID=2835532 RepID=UPI001BCE4A39|nr:glycosyltransferase [Roseococcus sp. SDR]MBS7789117.1 glycosyltransferase [Roseococcus sp. SDR]MBV1844431.1 glycosyltransferase [Roseococcus sp. SDR]
MRLMLDLQGVQGAARHAGLGRFSLELARALVRGRGAHEVQILLNMRLAESAARLAAEFTPLLGPTGIVRWTAPEGSAAGQHPQAPLRRLAENLRAEVIGAAAPDLLHLGSVFEGFRHDVVTTWPAERERPRIAATVHDLIPLTLRETYLDGHWREAGLVPWYARCLDELAACAPLLANSEATRAEVLRHLALPPDRVVVIGGGASPGFAPPPPDPAARTALLQRHGLTEGYLLYLGAGDFRKNEGLLLRAYAALPEGLRARHRLAIGHVNPPHLREMARGAGVAEHELICLPFIPDADLPGLYAAASLFVMPSLAEGFGLPLLEAMACGAACIASNRSALPEVLSRSDALFDPEDAGALTRLMQRLLEAPELRADLAAYGPRRARDFSWERAAAEAWAAFERAQPKAAKGRLARRKSLAIVSPLPPTPSGIADYTAELAPALAAHYAVTLVSAAPPEGPLAGRLPWISEEDFAEQGGRFDRVLYHIGNNPMHTRILQELLPRIPGVVTLHEAAITDLRNWLDRRADAPEPRTTRVAREEGYPALFAPIELAGSAGPMAEALGLVLHSGHARWLLETQYGNAALTHAHVLPLMRQPVALPAREAARAALGLAPEDLLVASFGIVTPQKLPERVLAGFAGLARAVPAARLVFVGEAQDGSAAVLAAAERQGLTGRVSVTGRVPPGTYQAWLAACDLAVQLRRGSRGETSAAAKDVLMAGRPLVSNRHGAMAEMEASGCRLVAEAAETAELAAALLEIGRDASLRAEMGAAARRWALWELNPDRIAAAYAAVLEHSYTHGPQAGLAQMLAASRDLPLSARDAAAAGLALARTFPGARQSRLWLDVGLGGLEPGILTLLREGLGALRPEPCLQAGDGWVTAHGWAWEKLELPGQPPPEGPAVMAAGDVLVAPPGLARDLAAAQGVRVLDGLHPGFQRGEGPAQRMLVDRLMHA